MNNKNIPPTYLFIAIFLIIAVHFLLPSFNKIVYPYDLLGFLPLLLGTYLNMSVWLLFKKHKTPHKYQKSTHIVKEGLFRFSRNPMYVGMILLLVGLSILFQNLLGLIVPVLFFFVIHIIFIPYEEEKMQKELGDEYLSYCKQVRRWI